MSSRSCLWNPDKIYFYFCFYKVNKVCNQIHELSCTISFVTVLFLVSLCIEIAPLSMYAVYFRGPFWRMLYACHSQLTYHATNSRYFWPMAVFIAICLQGSCLSLFSYCWNDIMRNPLWYEETRTLLDKTIKSKCICLINFVELQFNNGTFMQCAHGIFSSWNIFLGNYCCSYIFESSYEILFEHLYSKNERICVWIEEK